MLRQRNRHRRLPPVPVRLALLLQGHNAENQLHLGVSEEERVLGLAPLPHRLRNRGGRVLLSDVANRWDDAHGRGIKTVCTRSSCRDTHSFGFRNWLLDLCLCLVAGTAGSAREGEAGGPKGVVASADSAEKVEAEGPNRGMILYDTCMPTVFLFFIRHT